MAGPWEQYQTAAPEAAEGPWTAYGGGVGAQPKPTPTFTPGPAGFRKSLEESIAADVFPSGARVVGGIGSMFDNAAMRLKQLVTGLTPQETQKVEANRMLQEHPLGMLGAAAGGAMMAPVAPASLVGSALAGGAVSAATNPVLGGESEWANAAGGAAGAGLGNLLARGTSRVVRPILQSPATQRLLSEGIVPTPGQAAGGTLNKIEQKMESVLGPGDFIRLGRNRAQREFNEAALSRGMPDGQKATQTGFEGLAQSKAALGDAYDRVFSGKSVTPDAQLFAAIDAAKGVPTLPLNAAAAADFDAIIEKVVRQRVPRNGSLDASSMKAEMVGDLGKEAQKLLRSPIRAEQALGEALQAARDATQGWLVVQVGNASPGAAQALARIDPAYAAMKVAEKATERAKAAGGQFTPFQLQAASRPGSPMRALANDAQEVLGNRVPNSGSIDRAMAVGLLGIGGAGANEYFGGPGYLTALGLSPLLYSRLGSRYAIGALPGQQALAQGILSTSPLLQHGGRILGQE